MFTKEQLQFWCLLFFGWHVKKTQLTSSFQTSTSARWPQCGRECIVSWLARKIFFIHSPKIVTGRPRSLFIHLFNYVAGCTMPVKKFEKFIRNFNDDAQVHDSSRAARPFPRTNMLFEFNLLRFFSSKKLKTMENWYVTRHWDADALYSTKKKTDYDLFSPLLIMLLLQGSKMDFECCAKKKKRLFRASLISSIQLNAIIRRSFSYSAQVSQSLYTVQWRVSSV